jgi:hypothetical protein
MTESQRKTLREEAKKGCGHKGCKKAATVAVVWTFLPHGANATEGPINAFIRCDEHVEIAREFVPEYKPGVRVEITEEYFTSKPLVLN